MYPKEESKGWAYTQGCFPNEKNGDLTPMSVLPTLGTLAAVLLNNKALVN